MPDRMAQAANGRRSKKEALASKLFDLPRRSKLASKGDICMERMKER